MNNISSVLAKLHEVATIFSNPTAGHPLNEIFQRISMSLRDLLDVDHSTITLLDEGRRHFRVEAEYPQLKTPLVGRRISIQDRPSQFDLLNRQEPIVVDDLNSHALASESLSFRQIANTLDIRSLLIVPMVSDGKTIGTMSLDMIGRTRRFSREEIELCQTVANQTAAFIAIVRLQEEQQKYRRQAELIAAPPPRTEVSVREAKVAKGGAIFFL